MARGSPRPPGARAIIYAGALGGLSLARVNELLSSAGWATHAVPQGTWDMILKNEVPRFRKDPAELGRFIEKPLPAGDF